jgi:Flp pilus assembly protein TadB
MTAALLVLFPAGVLQFLLPGVLPQLLKRKADPNAFFTGSSAQADRPYRSWVEVVLLVLLRPARVARYRRAVETGPGFDWATFLDRQAAFALFGAAVLLLVTQNLAFALVGVAVGGYIPYMLAHRKAAAYRLKFLHQLPSALRLIASAMAAGRNFVNALEVTTPNLADPIASQLAALGQRIEALRVTESEAFQLWAERMGYPDLLTISSALAIGERVGLETYALMRSMADSIQAEIRGRAELEAATAQVKSTSTVITFLPVAFVLLLLFIAPGFVKPLYSTIPGFFAIFVAFALNMLSRWFTARILRSISL